MKQKTFLMRIPVELCEALDREASERFRKRNARTQMFTLILAERYQPKTPNADLFGSPRAVIQRRKPR